MTTEATIRKIELAADLAATARLFLEHVRAQDIASSAIVMPLDEHATQVLAIGAPEGIAGLLGHPSSVPK